MPDRAQALAGPNSSLDELAKSAMTRGHLRLYPATAPGVGKTFAMLGRRSRLHDLLHGAFSGRVIRLAGDMDVHVIADEDKEPTRAREHPSTGQGSRARRRAAWALAAVGLPLLV